MKSPKTRRTSLALPALTLLCLTPLAPPVAAQSTTPCDTGFINGKVEANGRSMVYVVYVPRNYTPEKPWPVILFLHGSGGVGADGFRPLFLSSPTVAGTLGIAVMWHPERFPCLVVFPQARSLSSAWNGPNEDLALRVLEEVVAKYNGDRNRVYLTGLSYGGEGTWKLASDHPELFAAAMPIATTDSLGLTPSKIALALKSMPLWVFHGAVDPIALPGTDRALVAALQAAGNANVYYTEYPGVGHNAWDLAYNDPKVIEWLLAQKR